MREKIKEAYERLMVNIGSVAKDKLLHFTAGVIIAAAWALLLPSVDLFCILPVLVLGAAKEVLDEKMYQRADANDLLATFIGGAFIWILVLL